MSNKYKIKVGETKVPDKVIEKHKNFAEVMTSYREITKPWYKIPLYKNPKAFLGLVMIVAMAFLVYEAVAEEEKMGNDGDGHSAFNILPSVAKDLPEFESLLADSLAETFEGDMTAPTEAAIAGKVPGVPAKPITPKLAVQGAFHFDLAYEASEYPELNGYDGIVWEYCGTGLESDPKENSWAFEKEWEELELVRQKDNTYALTFRAAEESFTTYAAPAFSEADYPAAEQAYKEKIREFYSAWSEYLRKGNL